MAVEAHAKELGVTIEKQDCQFVLDTTPGKVFAATLSHAIVYPREQDITLDETYKAMLEDMGLGLLICNDTDCDVCKPQITPTRRRRIWKRER